MIKKRLIGAVIVKNGWAVQSFGYNKYLPLGRPSILIKNLNRWGADEILVNVIDRSHKNLGPDYRLIEEIQSLSLDTPLIYAGGINSLRHAEQVINQGADRIVLESIVEKNFNEFKEISNNIGSQSIIAGIPVTINEKKIFKYNYLNQRVENFSKNWLKIISDNLVSEILVIDSVHEGYHDKFNVNLIEKFPSKKLKLICFGGITTKKLISSISKYKNVSAIAVGNSLNFKEHSIQILKKELSKNIFRKEFYY